MRASWLAGAAALLSLLCLAPPAAQALSFAYGGGASLNFSPVTWSGTYTSTSAVSTTSLQFFDATFVVGQVGYFLNRGITQTSLTPSTAVLTGLSLGISAKLPLRVGPVEVFPIAGVEYVLNLSYTDDKLEDLRAWLSGPRSSLDELWLKGGLGVDVPLGPVFLRPLVMAGWKPFGASTVTSSPPTGALTVAFGSWTVDVYVLFGYRF